ncbi:MocE family 2Fe-2S type ferredoxin [Paracoccus seriniphilus]|uniref:Rieske [2Fe-2S] domain protein, MocE subfamily n=1 Tax=Paracoccus seriniphilus TaxID=184748 RepID=A0A239Q2V7_9RHOB|nr:MocE family 2Fe-2S type ferredoxin [Paracoccus seriniphilus]WCR15588.1 Rieske 2Fe-2S domain-containing protein [Paracoccus seriniphilus]SNT76606.1 Rieske [2Fe-2S] domain protein, MocE subfamily [Paracoccus seriniphilus]
MTDWVYACAASDIDQEDLIRWDYHGKSYAIYNTERGFFATDGMCTHEAQHLEDGLVTGMVIECPLHQGRFDILTGKALSAPVCVDLQTYPVKVEAGRIYVKI